MKRNDRLLAIVAVLTLLAAWIVGAFLQGTDLRPFLESSFPSADRFDLLSEETLAAFQGDGLIGYATVAEGSGYGGPIKVSVAVGLDGAVLGTTIIESGETPSFFERVIGSQFLAQFIGKSYSDAFVLKKDLDGITGATCTAKGLASAVRQGGRRIAGEQLGLPVQAPDPIPVQFGVPEIAVILLYVAGSLGHKRRFRYSKQLRWAMLLTGMIVLGFWFNVPLTISKVNSFLLGYWPEWQTNLYWYLLIGGVFLIATVDNKNAYCIWFWPFGAAQECVAVIGGAKYSAPRLYRRHLVWVQRGLAWLAVMLALLFRNPGISSYEVFGTLFDFTGTAALFTLAAIVLVLSLFVKRPWCNYLCPLDPVYSIVRLVRNWVLEQWRKISRPSAAPSN